MLGATHAASTLYHAGVATLPELLAALDGYRRSGADDLPFGLDGDLIAAATALRDSPYEARFAASVGRVYVPMLRAVGFDPKQRPRLDLARSYMLLAMAPDQAFARDAIGAWRTSRAAPGGLAMSYWAFEPFAASAATPDDVDWAITHLEDRTFPYQTWPDRFLAGVRDRPEIERVLGALAKRPQYYLTTLWEMGRYSPAAVSSYLDAHVADVLRAAPPSQRAWNLAYGVANGPWAARTPAQWRTFLVRNLAARDTPTIHSAMLIVEKNWALRRRLERELSN